MISATDAQSHTEREAMLTRALRALDPEAVVNIDRDSGQLSVFTVLDENQVQTVLDELGVATARTSRTADAAKGGCCGSCG